MQCLRLRLRKGTLRKVAREGLMGTPSRGEMS